ncbi:flagellar hook-length control protein FliK [Geodermatophilus sp. SYSU D00691]
MTTPLMPIAPAPRPASPSGAARGSGDGAAFASALDGALSAGRPDRAPASERGVGREEAHARNERRAAEREDGDTPEPQGRAVGPREDAGRPEEAPATPADTDDAEDTAAEPAADPLPTAAAWALQMQGALHSATPATDAAPTAPVPGVAGVATAPVVGGTAAAAGPALPPTPAPAVGAPLPASVPADPAALPTPAVLPSSTALPAPAGPTTEPAAAAAAPTPATGTALPAATAAALDGVTVLTAPAGAAAPAAAVPAVATPDATAVAPDAAPLGAPVAGADGGSLPAGTGSGSDQPAGDGGAPPQPAFITGPAAAQPTAPTAPATSSAAAAAPAPQLPVNAQLSRPVAVLASRPDGVHTMTVVLTPENLGPVHVQVTVRGDSVDLTLAGAHEHGRATLLEALPDLRRDLQSAGVNTARLDVSRDTGGAWTAQQQGSEGGQQQPQHRGEPRTGSWLRSPDHGPDRPGPASPSSSALQGVDVRV